MIFLYKFKYLFCGLWLVMNSSLIAEQDFLFNKKILESHRFNQAIIDKITGLKAPKGDDFASLLKKAEEAETLRLKKVGPSAVENKYLYARERTYVLTKPHNCGKCDRWHIITATAWALSEDGLMVTNYHCFADDVSEGVAAVGYDLDFYPVTEVLIANKAEDFAVFKVKLPKGKKLKAFPLGVTAKPGDEVYLVSHMLKKHYFYYSKGFVSGYSSNNKAFDDDAPKSLWMQTELGYRVGSSGGAVFDNTGSVVGVACMISYDYENLSNNKSENPDWTISKAFEFVVPVSNLLKRLEFITE